MGEGTGAYKCSKSWGLNLTSSSGLKRTCLPRRWQARERVARVISQWKKMALTLVESEYIVSGSFFAFLLFFLCFFTKIE